MADLTRKFTIRLADLNISIILVRKAAIIIIGVLITLTVFIHFSYLSRYPRVFIDEPWYANTAWTWLREGRNFDSIHDGGRENVIWPYIGNIPLVVSFATLGLGLFQARLPSLIFGITLLTITVFVGRRCYGLITGLVAAMLLVLSPPFTQASHYARPDILLTTIVMLCYLLVLVSFDQERWWAHFLTGLLIILSMDIHQNAIFFSIGFFILYLNNYRKRSFKVPGTWLFLMGGVVGVIYNISVVVLPRVSVFLDYYVFSLGSSHQMPIQSFRLIDLLKSALAEIGRYHFFENRLEFVLIGVSIVFLSLRRTKYDHRLLIFLITVYSCFVLFVGNKHDIYAILLYPFLMLSVATTMVSIIREAALVHYRAFMVSLLCLVVISNGVVLVRNLNENEDYQYTATTDQIRKVIPAGARVMGLPDWWLGLADYDYYSSLVLAYYHIDKGFTLEEALDAVHPDYLIVDEGWKGLLVREDNHINQGFSIFNLPRQEFIDFLLKRGEKIYEFDDPWEGNIKVYSIIQ